MNGYNNACKGCFWSESCPAYGEPCEDYTPCDELADERVKAMVEQSRRSFHLEWTVYSAEYE